MTAETIKIISTLPAPCIERIEAHRSFVDSTYEHYIDAEYTLPQYTKYVSQNKEQSYHYLLGLIDAGVITYQEVDALYSYMTHPVPLRKEAGR